ncbi:hypothetical protein LTS18_000649 [Coniosporium uncinatum]|uniref:Uncharacterized protein n=1 Tax=Coniosporium uncinatum TaxID=93489 RepID=A0ACC3DVD8_9PEZI|nr:hypothetical protein LTS18_000649 [Coniosporium uncinatum]
MYTSLTAALALASTVSATAVSSTKWYSLRQVARFDNDISVPLTGAAPINEYLDIFWNGMSLVNTVSVAGANPGVFPNSPSNYAAYSVGDAATVLQGQPAMTVNYQDSTVDHFDLRSFYFGCAAGLQNGAVSLPLTCTVTATGKDRKGKQVARQSFKFQSNGGLRQNQIKATLSRSFVNLGSVEFKTTTGNAAADALVATVIDTVDYTVYGARPISN